MDSANEFLASGKPIYKIGVNISSETWTVLSFPISLRRYSLDALEVLAKE